MCTVVIVTQAFIKARKKDPNNKHVKSLMETGVPVNMLNRRTPDDVCLFRKFTANEFHDGGSLNVLEVISHIPNMEESWNAHNKEQKIKASNFSTRYSNLFCMLYLPARSP